MLFGQPVDAASFHCGKTFIAFQGKQGDGVGFFDEREDAIAFVTTSTDRDFSGIKIRFPDGGNRHS